MDSISFYRPSVDQSTYGRRKKLAASPVHLETATRKPSNVPVVATKVTASTDQLSVAVTAALQSHNDSHDGDSESAAESEIQSLEELLEAIRPDLVGKHNGKLMKDHGDCPENAIPIDDNDAEERLVDHKASLDSCGSDEPVADDQAGLDCGNRPLKNDIAPTERLRESIKASFYPEKAISIGRDFGSIQKNAEGHSQQNQFLTYDGLVGVGDNELIVTGKSQTQDNRDRDGNGKNRVCDDSARGSVSKDCCDTIKGPPALLQRHKTACLDYIHRLPKEQRYHYASNALCVDANLRHDSIPTESTVLCSVEPSSCQHSSSVEAYGLKRKPDNLSINMLSQHSTLYKRPGRARRETRKVREMRELVDLGLIRSQ